MVGVDLEKLFNAVTFADFFMSFVDFQKPLVKWTKHSNKSGFATMTCFRNLWSMFRTGPKNMTCQVIQNRTMTTS